MKQLTRTVAVPFRRRPRDFAIGSAVAALILTVLAVLSWSALLSDMRVNDRFTKAPQCTPAQTRDATRAVEHCRTEEQAFIGFSQLGGGADYPLTLEFDDGTTIIAPLQSQSDFDAFANAPPVVVTVWENLVTTIRLSGTTYQTRDHPGARIPGDIERGVVLTLLAASAAALIAVAVRAIRAQARLRASTAEIAAAFTPGSRDAVFPPGYGRPPEAWGEQPAQPGFGTPRPAPPRPRPRRDRTSP
jgi:hypothetical protein